MPKTRRGKQVLCDCGAYKFPHRLTGGACDGGVWVEFYFMAIRDECEECPLVDDTGCDVLHGLEPLTECAGYNTMKDNNDNVMYPCDLGAL